MEKQEQGGRTQKNDDRGHEVETGRSHKLRSHSSSAPCPRGMQSGEEGGWCKSRTLWSILKVGLWQIAPRILSSGSCHPGIGRRVSARIYQLAGSQELLFPSPRFHAKSFLVPSYFFGGNFHFFRGSILSAASYSDHYVIVSFLSWSWWTGIIYGQLVIRRR